MPEKSLQDVSRAWRDLYEKGKAAFDRNNLDYAISIFTQVLEKEPAFYDCREALRASQFKKAGIGGGGFFRKFLDKTNPKLVQARVTLRNNPLEALRIAEQILTGDPNDLSAHRVLADAALAADFPRTAVLSLEIVFKNSPKDRDVAMKLSKALAQAGQAARAEVIVGELARTYPNDPDIAQALKNVSASRTLSEGGYEVLASGQGSYRDILKNEEEAISLQHQQHDFKSKDVTASLIAEYEERIRKEPGNVRLLRSVAELYSQNKEFDKALEFYQRLAATETGDTTLQRAISDIHVKKYDHALSLLDPAAADYAAAAEKIKAEKQAFLLADCRARVDRYPNDLVLRFELGQLYLQAGRIGEAIHELQKAQNNPHKRVASMYHLGLCFAHRGMNDLAARTFQNAIKEKPMFDEEKKELIYALGEALEKLGKKEEAIEQFKLIYEVDIGYKDVAGKVDAYYAGQG